MHIILGDQITEEIADKYIVLELDSFRVSGRDSTVSAFCLIENVPLDELPQADQFRDLHAQMIKDYRLGRWPSCQDAIQHLMGRWNGEMDTFYQDLLARLDNASNQDPTQHWDPAIKI